MFGLKTKTNRVIKHLFYQDGLKLIRLDPSGVACNHKCVMCWLQQLSPQQKSKIAVTYNQNKLSISDYKLLIESAPKSLETVELVGGGEPLLYPEIDQLIQIVKQKKINGSLITNGSLLTTNIQQTLIKYGWDVVRFSMHAACDQTYKDIHGTNDFCIVIDNIRALLSKREHKLPWIKLLFVIQKGNYHEANEFMSLAEQLGVDEVEFDYLIPTSKDELFLSKKEVSALKKSLKNLKSSVINNRDIILKMFEDGSWSRNKKRKSTYYKDKYCSLNHLEISQMGVTSPCCLLWNTKANRELNIKDSNISSIWKSYSAFRKDLRKGKFTPECINNCYYNLPKK